MTIRRLAAAGAASLFLVCPGHADDIQTRIARDETVTSRPHPETDPLGIRLGAFILSPDVADTEGYTDNVYASHLTVEDDLVTTLGSKFALRSDWSNNSLSLVATDQQSLYARHVGEDANDYGVKATGRLDITQDDRLNFDTGYTQGHEPRSSPDNAFGKTPTDFSTEYITIGSFDKFNRLSLDLGATAVKYEYTDVATSLGSFIEQRDRDRWEDQASIRLGYEIQPQYEAVLRAEVDQHDYIHQRDTEGYERSSKGETITAGLAFDLTGVTFGEVGIGVLNRNYQDPRFGAVRGISAKVGVTWNATPLMTLRLGASRDVGETSLVGSPGVVNKAANLTLDHELLRNLLLNAQLGIVAAQYRDIPQHQVTLTDEFGATYILNHSMRMTAKYDRTNCDSTNQTSTFTQNIVSLSMKLML